MPQSPASLQLAARPDPSAARAVSLPIVPLEAGALPPPGASSAGDLQRRLSEAALRGFFAERAEPARHGAVALRPAALIGAGAAVGAVAATIVLLYR